MNNKNVLVVMFLMLIGFLFLATEAEAKGNYRDIIREKHRESNRMNKLYAGNNSVAQSKYYFSCIASKIFCK